MKTWKLASRRLPCGYQADCWIADGAPYLERVGQGWRLVRCEKHAGEPVGVIEQAIRPSPPRQDTAKPLRWLATQVERKMSRMTLRGDFDARMKAAGRDE